MLLKSSVGCLGGLLLLLKESSSWEEDD